MLLAQHFETGGPTYFRIFVGGTMLLVFLGLVVAALYYTHRWLQGERGPSNPISVLLLGIPVLLGIAFLGAIVVWSLTGTPSPPDVQWAYGPYPEGVDAQHAQTLDELYDKQTQPKIVLEESATPSGESSTEEPAANRQVTAKLQAKVVTQSKEKPDWVANPPKRVGNVNRRSVSSGPYKTLRECYRGIERSLSEATEERFNQVVHSQPGMSRSHLNMRRYNINSETILREFCSEEYIEPVESPSVGKMKKLHVLMEFGPEQDRYLLNQWRRYERDERIAVVLVTATLVLGTFALVWGLLWFDTWTRGYYTKRLFVGVPAAIIAGLGVIVLIAENM